MGAGNLIDQVREGMEVRASDGARVGKVSQMWYGSEPTERFAEDETVMEVRPGFLRRGDTLYIPNRALADVSGGRVLLATDAEGAKQFGRKPSWIGS